MRILGFLMLFITSITLAQEEKKVDTSVGNESDARVEHRVVIDIDIEKDTTNVTTISSYKNHQPSTRWLLPEIGMNALLYDGNINLPDHLGDLDLKLGRSREFNLHLFRQKANLIKHHVNLEYGIKLSWNNYHFKKDIRLAPEADSLTVDAQLIEGNDYKKNKLRTTSIELPIALNFETNPTESGRSFRITAGGYVGFVSGIATIQKSEIIGKVKKHDSFNMNRFRYGLTALVGYGPVNLYAKYGLSDFFKNDEGPKLNHFSLGFSFTY